MSALRNPQWGNEAFAMRYKQIDSLRQYFPNVKEVTKDNVYEVVVLLPSRKTITIRITLAREFPYQPPTLQIMPQVIHKYVNGQMMVLPQIHEKLASWSVHTNLGKTMHEIVQKFMQDPPVVGTSGFFEAPVTQTTPPPPYSSTVATSSATSTKNTIPLPAIPASFPILEQKDITELTALMNSPDSITELVMDMDQVKSMQSIMHQLAEGNQTLAGKNLAASEALEQLKQELASKRDELQRLRAAYDQKAARQQEILHQFTPAALIDKLSDASAEADAESEQIAAMFLDGSTGDAMDYKEFMKKFMERRKVYHLRAAKKESLTMSINR